MADCPVSGDLSHRGTVLRNLEVAPGCVRLEIDCPTVAPSVRPGQFVMLRSREGIDPFLSRAFSVCDLLHGDGPKAPATGFVVLILVVGVGTKALAERQAGEPIGVLGPLGRAYDLGTPDEHMVLVAGGIGAAPFLIVAKALRRRSKTQRITYLVGGRDRDHVYLADELRALACEVREATDDGSLGHKGFVTDLLPPLLVPGVRVLACGPNPMFKSLAKVAEKARAGGLSFPCEVSTEETMPCGFGACAGCVVPVAAPVTPDTPDGWRYAKSCVEGPVFPVEAIRWDLIRSSH
jgi:dihydroorotate dehydrogenase electron transfer subunit